MAACKANTAALAVLTAIFGLCACTSPPQKPVTMTELPPCGWLPNCVNSASGTGIQGAEPLAADRTLWQALKAWLGQQQDWAVVTDAGDFMQLTVTTPTVGFTDDVQLLFLPDQQVIQVRSSSRLGISDLGANASRVEFLRRQLADLD